MVAKKLNSKQLEKDLIRIWKKYIKNPSDKENLKKAKEIYSNYWTASAFSLTPKKLEFPLFNLVDIAWNTGNKVDKKRLEKIKKELKIK